eukprot:jgi/Ulvmu1/5169/UM021_0186.1
MRDHRGVCAPVCTPYQNSLRVQSSTLSRSAHRSCSNSSEMCRGCRVQDLWRADQHVDGVYDQNSLLRITWQQTFNDGSHKALYVMLTCEDYEQSGCARDPKAPQHTWRRPSSGRFYHGRA